MDLRLTQLQRDLRELAARFAHERVLPRAAEWDRNSHTPVAELRKAATLGLGCLTVPEKLGGAGLGLVEAVLVAEELAVGCAGFASAFTLNMLPAEALLAGGDDWQVQAYVPRLATGEFAAYGMTEPSAGSDVANIATVASRTATGYRLNGAKVWITNSPLASFFVIFAKTDPAAGRRGISAFVVERDAAGLHVGKALPKLGQRAAPACELHFDDVDVPAHNLLGGEGEGFEIAMRVFVHTRPVIAAIATGLTRRCLIEANRYARERSAMGVPLVRHQQVGSLLAGMSTDLAASRLLTYQAAWTADTSGPSALQASHAKLFAAQAAVRSASTAVQIFGGMGYSAEYPVEKLYRDAKLFEIYEGTNEIQRLIIGRELSRADAGRVGEQPGW